MGFEQAAYAEVFKSRGYTGEEALTLMLRLDLILQIKAEIEKRNWTQREAACALNVPQPRISEILSLSIDKFSAELLAKLLFRLNPSIRITVSNSGGDNTGI